MTTTDLRLLLKIIAHSEAEHRIVLEVEGTRYDIETIVVSVGSHFDGITRIVAKKQSGHEDQDPQPCYTPPYYIQRGFPHPEDIESVPNTNPVPDQTPGAMTPHPSCDVRISISTVRSLRESIGRHLHS